MGYLVDRARAFRDTDIVAAVSIRQRGARSRLILRDGSLWQTLTRVRTLRRKSQEATAHVRLPRDPLGGRGAK